MEIKTNFGLGDEAWTIRDCKAVCFKIGYICYEKDTIYYACSRYGDVVPEKNCFATRQLLIEHISNKGNERM